MWKQLNVWAYLTNRLLHTWDKNYSCESSADFREEQPIHSPWVKIWAFTIISIHFSTLQVSLMSSTFNIFLEQGSKGQNWYNKHLSWMKFYVVNEYNISEQVILGFSDILVIFLTLKINKMKNINSLLVIMFHTQ